MSDIDIAVADSLKVLDLKRPIREADIVVGRRRANSDASRNIYLVSPSGKELRGQHCKPPILLRPQLGGSNLPSDKLAQ